MSILDKIFGDFSKKELKKIEPIVKAVADLEPKYKAMSSGELAGETVAFKKRLADGETLEQIMAEAFAVCREASSRVLFMRHFDVQIIGGAVLCRRRIAEMKTGEGKTLVATLAAYLNALEGNGVHVVTVNDYLARRDSEWMGKLYRYLGLSVGVVSHGMTPDERRAAYNCDITYGTNNEFGFDYLRDNMVTYKENKVQRGHYFAIVDEVDSILIDEARTPLIISGAGDKSSDLYKLANTFARGLKAHRMVEMDSKQEHDETVDADYIIDEKHKTASLTKRGIEKAERFFSVENLAEGESAEINHHINQAIRAYGVMKRDVDYIVKNGEVVIVDEFTGRQMVGRRYSAGLHQAIEAKENVTIARENRTLATITFQNYFRMYKGLSGMTGTAKTEAGEFSDIYGLEVVEIPPNKPNRRKDHDDSVYKSEAGKYRAVVEQVVACHEKGQPVLVGTISIDKSEEIAAMLKRRGIKHNVLNAKFHEQEAGIVAQAGQFGAVTIATNMAGRGTDIILGGNIEFMAKEEMAKKGFLPEHIVEATGHGETDDAEILAAREAFDTLSEKHREEVEREAEKVKNAGGLFIIGTERHESRRIDNQLRGRSGRQGDVGETRFYISLEDDLMRLFGGERVQGVMNTLGVDEDTPIENRMVTGTIESSQKRLEARNFSTRKNVLDYDDVMNSQREIIYSQRAKVLDGQDVTDNVKTMIEESIESQIARNLTGDSKDDWNLNELRSHYLGWLTTEQDFEYSHDELEMIEPQDIALILKERAFKLFEKRRELLGEARMQDFERYVLLKTVDLRWMEHIDAMDELRRGIHLRSYGQRNPVIEYRMEGFDMFDDMIETIKEETARIVLTAKLVENQPIVRKQVAKVTGESGGGGGEPAVKKPDIRKGPKVGRNDPCPCGSGKKYKKCCEGSDNVG